MFVRAAGRCPSWSGASLCCMPLSKVAKNSGDGFHDQIKELADSIGTQHRTFAEIGWPCSLEGRMCFTRG